MPLLTTPCHKLYYTTAGNGHQPALLMLHGFLGNHQDFDRVVSILSKHFYCILPDLPGHGQTLTQPNGYTFPSVSASLLALLDKLNCKQAYLLGYSMGGRIALYMACHAPSRFIKVILESASPGLKTLVEQEERKRRDWAIAQKLETIPLPDFLDIWYKHELFKSLRSHPKLYREMRSRRQNNNPIELANALRGFSTGVQPSLWKALSKIAQPLLLIVGDKDPKFVKIAQQMLASQQSENKRISIEYCTRCGHNIHLEQPSIYANAIVQFALDR